MNGKSIFVGMSLGAGAAALVGIFWKEICEVFRELTEDVIEDFGRSRG